MPRESLPIPSAGAPCVDEVGDRAHPRFAPVASAPAKKPEAALTTTPAPSAGKLFVAVDGRPTAPFDHEELTAAQARIPLAARLRVRPDDDTLRRWVAAELEATLGAPLPPGQDTLAAPCPTPP